VSRQPKGIVESRSGDVQGIPGLYLPFAHICEVYANREHVGIGRHPCGTDCFCPLQVGLG
jgi:hypothetical protein